MRKYQEYFNAKFAKLKKTIPTRDCIKILDETIKNQSERIEMLESKVAIMEKYIKHLEKFIDDQEQYTSRLCLRIRRE